VVAGEDVGGDGGGSDGKDDGVTPLVHVDFPVPTMPDPAQ